MRLKKLIRQRFNSIPVPPQSKVLPSGIAVKKCASRSFRATLAIAAIFACLFVIAIGLFVTNREISSQSTAQSGLGGEADFQSEEPNDSSAVDTSENSWYIGGVGGISSDPVLLPNEQDPVEPNPSDPSPRTVYTTGEVGEFAADMYRPEGYSNKIGSVLAIMMSMNDNEQEKFNVLVKTFDLIDLEQLLLSVVGEAQRVTINIDGEFVGESYYARLTEDQINTLLGYGVSCFYIGSGTGNVRDMNWETEAGIKAYCEFVGDMYTFNDTTVDCNPDIHIVD